MAHLEDDLWWFTKVFTVLFLVRIYVSYVSLEEASVENDDPLKLMVGCFLMFFSPCGSILYCNVLYIWMVKHL